MNVEQGRALESSGAYHLDEIVNKFLSGETYALFRRN